ncbi:MAG TPA: hypothetical protein VNZ45_03445, partial [Bacteroidia bacterium]|nr:hypothetical protein [Bacteroidia bacterium]
MQNPTSYILPILLIAFAIFIRIKRSIGFQKYRIAVPIARILICTLILVIVFSFGFLFHPSTLLPDAGGIVAGIGLAFLGVRHAKFEMRKDGLYYRTHIWVEIGILVLFFARLAWRFYDIYGSLGSIPGEQVASQLRYEKDPVTGSIISVFCTYYIGYFIYIASKA